MAGSIFALGSNLNLWVATICGVIVLAMTIVFENALHGLEHAINERASDISVTVYQQMIQKLYKELMVLGFISFILSLLLQTETVTDHEQIMSFEYAHFVLFFMALCLILHAVAIAVTSNIFASRCNRSMGLTFPQLRLIFDEKRSKKRQQWFPDDLFFDMVFNLLRLVFIRTYDLPVDIDFAGYYGMVKDRTVVHTMDIDTSSWLVFICLMGCNALYQQFISEEPPSSHGADPCDQYHSVANESDHRRLGGAVAAADTSSYDDCQHRRLGGGGDSGPAEPTAYASSVYIQYLCTGCLLVLVLMLGLVWVRSILKRILHAGGLSVGNPTDSMDPEEPADSRVASGLKIVPLAATATEETEANEATRAGVSGRESPVRLEKARGNSFSSFATSVTNFTGMDSWGLEAKWGLNSKAFCVMLRAAGVAHTLSHTRSLIHALSYTPCLNALSHTHSLIRSLIRTTHTHTLSLSYPLS
jgi:hypothetical protein